MFYSSLECTIDVSFSDRMELCEATIDTSEQETKRVLAMRLAIYNNDSRGRIMFGFFEFFRSELTLDQIAVSAMRILREDTSISPIMEAITFQMNNIVEDCVGISKLSGRIAILSSRSLYHIQSRNELLVFIIFVLAS